MKCECKRNGIGWIGVALDKIFVTNNISTNVDRATGNLENKKTYFEFYF